MSTEALELVSNQPITTFPKRNQKLLALHDFWDALKKWRIWFLLAYQDIKLRYRRSILGPFWITISMAITVYSMGYLYGHLFHTNLQTYFPFLVAGMLSWALISSTIMEQTEAFILAEGLVKQVKLPYFLYIHRVVTRNFLIFFHNILVIIPVLAIFHEVAKINFYTLMLIPGLFIIYINAVCYGLVLAMIGARYRDLSQIIKSLVQVVFFITPIMWNPSTLPEKNRYFAVLNPFYAFVELIRTPLMGFAPTLLNFIIVGVITLIGILLCVMIFPRYRARIIYWL
jgi:lipopolysaccharide transport system permease protein